MLRFCGHNSALPTLALFFTTVRDFTSSEKRWISLDDKVIALPVPTIRHDTRTDCSSKLIICEDWLKLRDWLQMQTAAARDLGFLEDNSWTVMSYQYPESERERGKYGGTIGMWLPVYSHRWEPAECGLAQLLHQQSELWRVARQSLKWEKLDGLAKGGGRRRRKGRVRTVHPFLFSSTLWELWELLVPITFSILFIFIFGSSTPNNTHLMPLVLGKGAVFTYLVLFY